MIKNLQVLRQVKSVIWKPITWCFIWLTMSRHKLYSSQWFLRCYCPWRLCLAGYWDLPCPTIRCIERCCWCHRYNSQLWRTSTMPETSGDTMTIHRSLGRSWCGSMYVGWKIGAVTAALYPGFHSIARGPSVRNYPSSQSIGNTSIVYPPTFKLSHQAKWLRPM